MSTRRRFITALLGAPAALFALTRVAKTQLPAPPHPLNEGKPPLGHRHPCATTCYQRLYVRLEQRCERYGNNDNRTVWINGTSANGERDVFFQHQRRTGYGWMPTSTFRYSHRDDINNRIISYPKCKVELTIDVVPVMRATVPWMKDVVAIARWTETEGRA